MNYSLDSFTSNLRSFLKTGALAAGGLALPNILRSAHHENSSHNGTLNIACIGIGGKGSSDSAQNRKCNACAAQDLKRNTPALKADPSRNGSIASTPELSPERISNTPRASRKWYFSATWPSVLVNRSNGIPRTSRLRASRKPMP